MLELGRRLATRVIARSARPPPGPSTWLVVVGRGAAGIAAGAIDAGLDPARVLQVVRTPSAALEALVPRLRAGDVVLVKASRGIALESIVDGLRRELGEGAPR